MANNEVVRVKKQANFLSMIIMLTILFVSAQSILFLIHYNVSDLMDSLVNSSISKQLFYPVVLFPILQFLFVQLAVHALLISWIWLITMACADIFLLKKIAVYWLGIINWLVSCGAILALNHYYFPDSFFSLLLDQARAFNHFTLGTLYLGIVSLPLETGLAIVNAVWFKRHWRIGSILFACGMIAALATGFHYCNFSGPSVKNYSQPNVIIIGLDSVRPDFLSYFGNEEVATPNIDQFLQTATTFTHAYTPLARTYPAWVSILTAKYPLHTTARNNLVAPEAVLTNATLAQRFQEAGYTTMYATDEKRFSNITEAYGFDKMIGPGIGVNDFVLGGLNDFPLTNLLINLSIGQYLFPFNHANRAAAITYQPETFSRELSATLAKRPNKPLFLAVHFCLSHWPFSWAREGMQKNNLLAQQYRASVAAVDAQLGVLFTQLKQQGLLENSLFVLLSDHGTTLGLPGDRMVTAENYIGAPEKIKLLSVERLGSAPLNSLDFEHDYKINTVYGQGNDLLSLKQHHVLLAFKFAGKHFPARWNNEDVSLLDVAPTILKLLNMPALTHTDGVSLTDNLFQTKKLLPPHTGLFMETGDSMAEIETDHIYVEKVVRHEIGMYRINPSNGFLYVDPLAEAAIIKNKQLGILWKDWLLVRYPAHMRLSFAAGKNMSPAAAFKEVYVPPFYVLANINSGQWTVGLDTTLAKSAPVGELLRKLKTFYGEELQATTIPK